MQETNVFTSDVISQVVIHANVHEAWIDGLTAASHAMQAQYKRTVIGFSEDSALLSQNGVLNLCAFVAGERVLMEVPSEYWQWKAHATV